MKDGVDKYGRYLRKKGWINDEDLREGAKEGRIGKWSVDGEENGQDDRKSDVANWWVERGDVSKGGEGRWWGKGEDNVRWLVEFATAYTIVKVSMPLRIIGCVWATPWFARIFVDPFGRSVKVLRSRTTRG